MSRLQEIQDQIKLLQEEERQCKLNLMVVCRDCGKRQRLRNTISAQGHWYVQPHGCTGGDYYNEYDYWYTCCNECGCITKHGPKDRLYRYKNYTKGTLDVYEANLLAYFAEFMRVTKNGKNAWNYPEYFDLFTQRKH